MSFSLYAKCIIPAERLEIIRFLGVDEWIFLFGLIYHAVCELTSSFAFKLFFIVFM